jgi:hypothetical protein
VCDATDKQTQFVLCSYVSRLCLSVARLSEVVQRGQSTVTRWPIATSAIPSIFPWLRYCPLLPSIPIPFPLAVLFPRSPDTYFLLMGV